MMTIVLLVSFGVLLLLGISHFLRKKFANSPSIPFTYWWQSHQVCLWVILAVGLIQVHFDCMSLWGDCYAHNYPFWVMEAKPLLLHSTNLWSLLAITMTARNLCVIMWQRSQMSELSSGR